MSTEQQTFILTEDTKGISQKLPKDFVPENTDAILNSYFKTISGVIRTPLQENNILLTLFNELTIENALTDRATEILTTDNETVCICLDRFLLANLEIDQEIGSRFTRLEVCRNIQGERVARQGAESLENQISTIGMQFPDIKNRRVLIVDDGVFSGGTVEFVAGLLSQIGIDKGQISVLGFIGDNASEKLTKEGIKTEVLFEAKNLYDWVDLRDFGVFGGKMLAKSKNGNVSSSIPYLYPFSMGEGASFDKFGQLFTVSSLLINEQIKLFNRWEEETGKIITFSDLVKSGFPLPTNSQKNIKPSINNRVVDFLSICLDRIKDEQERDVRIFDMDGTLYQLDGENNGFSGSTLEVRVLENAKKFIIESENVSSEAGQTILEFGLKDPIGLSAFLSKRYSITRKGYFDNVWNINPQDIIKDFEIPVETIKKLKNSNTKLILLTSAAKVWQQQVISFLGLEDIFETIYTAEDFGTKAEIFKILSERYTPEKITSYGDQEKTDIEPARQFGINGILIQSPNDFASL